MAIDEEAVERVAGRLPIERGRSAAGSAARLPSGQMFGVSPAATSLAEAWRLAADHHRLVTTQLQDDLVALRDALTVVLDNTAESEAEASARYVRATEEYATEAEQRSAGLSTVTDEFVEANESEVADELAAQRESELVDGQSAGQPSADGEAADGPSTTPDGEAVDSPTTSPDGGTAYGPSTQTSDAAAPSHAAAPSDAAVPAPTGGNGLHG